MLVYNAALDHGKHPEPYCLCPVYRRHVTGRREDIRSSMPDGPFACLLPEPRLHVLRAALQQHILRRLLLRLRPGGVLVLGVGETLPTGARSLIQIEDDLPLYRHRPHSEAGAP